jgi:UDP-N-acetylglucosamine 2-epimerase (hydrolysing)
MKFEYFLTLLKNSQFIIGNSSSGIREAPVYGVPSIDIGTRQLNRSKAESIVNSSTNEYTIIDAIKKVQGLKFSQSYEFGKGNSIELFYDIISDKAFWETSIQKQFVD